MKILTINSGSTSIKFKLFSMPDEKVIASGKIEEIGGKSSVLNYQTNGYEEKDKKCKVPDHMTGLNIIIEKLSNPETGVIEDRKEIYAIGHRVVNIGDKASIAMIIDDKVMEYIKDCLDLAPLHNPPNLIGIEVCRRIFGKSTPNIAVFDNTFHKDMPEKAYLYGIPYDLYEKYKIRKYGFHGIAYTYMVERVAKLLKKDLKTLKIIALMLGGGSSITAVKYGKTIDTSMGFTPAEGLFMSTRSGDLDPSVITYIMKREDMDIEGIDDMINKKSGLLGLSKKFKDFKDIENGVLTGDRACIRAFNSYCYKIKKYIGSYIAAMNGVDVIVFGGGIGENSYIARREILKDIDYLGIELDKSKNEITLKEDSISTNNSKVPIFVINIDEEVIIARETYSLTKK